MRGWPSSGTCGSHFGSGRSHVAKAALRRGGRLGRAGSRRRRSGGLRASSEAQSLRVRAHRGPAFWVTSTRLSCSRLADARVGRFGFNVGGARRPIGARGLRASCSPARHLPTGDRPAMSATLCGRRRWRRPNRLAPPRATRPQAHDRRRPHRPCRRRLKPRSGPSTHRIARPRVRTEPRRRMSTNRDAGKITVRSNVVLEPGRWDLVPGELLHAVRRMDKATRLHTTRPCTTSDGPSADARSPR